MKKYKRYRKKWDYSYTMGPFPTFELLDKRPELLEHVFISEDFNDVQRLTEKLEVSGVPYSFSERVLNRLALKDKEYVIGAFRKETSALTAGNHVLLDGIDNFGNLGTIMRSMLGLGVKNLVLIGPTCDPFHPQVVRASMGAWFDLNIATFDSLADYKTAHPEQNIYAFLLDEKARSLGETRFNTPYTLAFGNEGAGLPQDVYASEQGVFIEQTADVDSLNLPIAAGIALYTAGRNGASSF